MSIAGRTKCRRHKEVVLDPSGHIARFLAGVRGNGVNSVIVRTGRILSDQWRWDGIQDVLQAMDALVGSGYDNFEIATDRGSFRWTTVVPRSLRQHRRAIDQLQHATSFIFKLPDAVEQHTGRARNADCSRGKRRWLECYRTSLCVPRCSMSGSAQHAAMTN
jgi:hypothetical protein